MSLDVTLTQPAENVPCVCTTCGHEHESFDAVTVYQSNITHNLTLMAFAAGIYAPLWCPGENGFAKARDLIDPLSEGLARLRADPDRFRQFDAPNGWGTYDHFVPWVSRYLAACREHPDADVSVCK